jgi:Cys-rich repeat protein
MVDSDCGSGTCMDLFVDAEAVSGMCVSNVSTCGADADCGAGEVCRLIETAAGGATVCGPPLGELGPGEVCRKLFRQDALGPDQRCASLSCEKLSDVSVCPTLCSTDRDCPVEHHCAFGERTVNGRGTFDRTDDVVVTHGVCEHSPGGGTPCSANADCPDFEGCYDTTRADGTATRMCLLTYSTAAVGADCTVGTADICRAARTCLVDFTTLHEYCAAPCATDADCGETGLVCRTTRDDRRDVPRTLCVAADDPRFPT